MTSHSAEGRGAGAAGCVPLRTEELYGERALFVPRWTTWARAGRLVLGAMALGCLVAAMVLVRVSEPGVATLLVLAGVVIGGFLVRDVCRMPYDGGVWLTPTRIGHRWGGQEWVVRWEEVMDRHVVPEGLRLVLRSGRDAFEDPVVSNHLLVVSHRTLVMLLDTLGEDPAKRAALGTETGLRAAEQIRATADGAGFRVEVRGAPRPSAGLLFTSSLLLVVLVLGLATLGRSWG
jgi:hypothetical protein